MVSYAGSAGLIPGWGEKVFCILAVFYSFLMTFFFKSLNFLIHSNLLWFIWNFFLSFSNFKFSLIRISWSVPSDWNYWAWTVIDGNFVKSIFVCMAKLIVRRKNGSDWILEVRLFGTMAYLKNYIVIAFFQRLTYQISFSENTLRNQNIKLEVLKL